MRTYSTIITLLCAALGLAVWGIAQQAQVLERYIKILHTELPDDYFSDRSVRWRINRLAADWRKAIMVNKDLEFTKDAAYLADDINYDRYVHVIEYYNKLYPYWNVDKKATKRNKWGWQDFDAIDRRRYEMLLRERAKIEHDRAQDGAMKDLPPHPAYGVRI